MELKEPNNSNESKKNLYFNVQTSIKNARIQKYFRERDEISKEGLTFLGYFNKKNDLQIEKLKNLKLKIQLLQTAKIESKDKCDKKDMMSDLYACAISDLAGKFTPEMSNLYNEIKTDCTENPEELEECIYKMALQKIANSKNYLPIVHKEKHFDIFGDTKAQIEFLKLENKNIENQIVLERGSKFETQFK